MRPRSSACPPSWQPRVCAASFIGMSPFMAAESPSRPAQSGVQRPHVHRLPNHIHPSAEMQRRRHDHQPRTGQPQRGNEQRKPCVGGLDEHRSQVPLPVHGHSANIRDVSVRRGPRDIKAHNAVRAWIHRITPTRSRLPESRWRPVDLRRGERLSIELPGLSGHRSRAGGTGRPATTNRDRTGRALHDPARSAPDMGSVGGDHSVRLYQNGFGVPERWAGRYRAFLVHLHHRMGLRDGPVPARRGCFVRHQHRMGLFGQHFRSAFLGWKCFGGPGFPTTEHVIDVAQVTMEEEGKHYAGVSNR
ncbi:hypothetical protein DFR68_107498 [Nocardia mexicana]|uniref:Uncharacterized protein n=1 Tax=Nocardia mexicana TaxID=279262 RepID=A0A370H0A9_9NOCA|nr:hypothetical protein DFR68_107498 [Nocardia mexicana]